MFSKKPVALLPQDDVARSFIEFYAVPIELLIGDYLSHGNVPENTFLLRFAHLVQKDKKKIQQWIAKRLQETDKPLTARESLLFGIAHQAGLGVALNLKKAFVHFQQAIDGGVTLGNLYIAEMYYKGLGVERDYTIAKLYFGLAAKAGIARAYTFLGICDSESIASSQYYSKACEYGDAIAHFYLAECLSSRRSSKSVNHIDLYQKAAKGGDPTSLTWLGLYFRSKKQLTTAAIYLRLAAERGYAGAIINLRTLLQECHHPLVTYHAVLGLRFDEMTNQTQLKHTFNEMVNAHPGVLESVSLNDPIDYIQTLLPANNKNLPLRKLAIIHQILVAERHLPAELSFMTLSMLTGQPDLIDHLQDSLSKEMSARRSCLAQENQLLQQTAGTKITLFDKKKLGLMQKARLKEIAYLEVEPLIAAANTGGLTNQPKKR